MERIPGRYNGRGDTVLAIVLDCTDLDRSASFWCAALGYVTEGGGQQNDSPYRQLLPADGQGVELLLQKTPDHKITKNRMHIDLRHPDLVAETTRLLGVGAQHTTGTLIEEDGWSWYVLADPDGNELCVLQPPDDNPGS